MGKTGRHKRGILPKRLRRKIERSPKPKSLEAKKKEVQDLIYLLEYRRSTLAKVGNQRSALIECALTDRINQGRKLLEDIEKQQKKMKEVKNGKKKSA